MARRDQYAVDTVLPFFSAFTDRGPGFVERCGLTRKKMLHTAILKKVLFDHRGGGWEEGELVRLRSEI